MGATTFDNMLVLVSFRFKQFVSPMVCFCMFAGVYLYRCHRNLHCICKRICVCGNFLKLIRFQYRCWIFHTYFSKSCSKTRNKPHAVKVLCWQVMSRSDLKRVFANFNVFLKLLRNLLLVFAFLFFFCEITLFVHWCVFGCVCVVTVCF